MKISDTLLCIIHKHNSNRHSKMTMPSLANYVKELLRYDMLEIDEDGLSFGLSDKGLSKLVGSGLLEFDK